MPTDDRHLCDEQEAQRLRAERNVLIKATKRALVLRDQGSDRQANEVLKNALDEVYDMKADHHEKCISCHASLVEEFERPVPDPGVPMPEPDTVTEGFDPSKIQPKKGPTECPNSGVRICPDCIAAEAMYANMPEDHPPDRRYVEMAIIRVMTQHSCWNDYKVCADALMMVSRCADILEEENRRHAPEMGLNRCVSTGVR